MALTCFYKWRPISLFSAPSVCVFVKQARLWHNAARLGGPKEGGRRGEGQKGLREGGSGEGWGACGQNEQVNVSKASLPIWVQPGREGGNPKPLGHHCMITPSPLPFSFNGLPYSKCLICLAFPPCLHTSTTLQDPLRLSANLVHL